MKVISLSVNGIKPARLVRADYLYGDPHALSLVHGVVRPVVIPVYEYVGYFKTLNYRLVKLEKNKFMLIRCNDEDTANEYLVLWSLSSEILGNVKYAVKGKAKTIAEGYEMNGISCPVVHVTGSCRLLWYRALCDKGDPPFLEAVFNRKDWIIRSTSSY
jgi:hypothetical protein